MRTIEFRGKANLSKQWLYGQLVYVGESAYILQNPCYGSVDNYEVIPETVGQFTGLTDKNGTKIFEGDINVDKSVVNFENGIYYSGNNSLFYLLEHCETLEIIGNIYDNPELIK